MSDKKSRIATGGIIMQLLDPAGYCGESEHGWTLDEAADRIDHITIRGRELYETLAYLACQVHGYRERSDRDATLAINQIEMVISRYRERRPNVSE